MVSLSLALLSFLGAFLSETQMMRFVLHYDHLLSFGLVTHVFVHEGFMHALGNWTTALPCLYYVETKRGKLAAAALFFLSTTCGAVLQASCELGAGGTLVGSSAGTVGASAAAFALMMQDTGLPGWMRRSGAWVLAAYSVRFAFVAAAIGTLDTVAHFAHLGGLLAGVYFALFLGIFGGKYGDK